MGRHTVMTSRIPAEPDDFENANPGVPLDPAHFDDGTLGNHFGALEPAAVASQAVGRVFDRLVESAADQLHLPHIVIIRCGHLTHYSGPFPDAMSAACAAEMELSLNRFLPIEEHVETHLAPLLAAVCPHTPDPTDRRHVAHTTERRHPD
jgi:hypothetical protein